MHFDNEHLKDPNSPDLGYLMYLFAGFMLIVAITAWLYIPKVQSDEDRQRADTCIPSYTVPSKTLEELAEGRAKVKVEDRVGFKERAGALRRRLQRKRGT